ncbi:DedA family protein [Halorubrum vacuolatum]|uniref:Membrane protein DedA, SNARE-associated domain n=1 Tax=Halorubrum vacuolatum TaxID=63740 RepID=A0A238WQL2_HALVU|nr:VTT domain-containing protein [Halorubrum vacuolatum]SNR48832.1 membrane protein DedA, SNARE-associated domain [Halorubrum vacuolatum]
MLDATIDAAFALLLYVGLPALFIFFILKGALIGKPLPTSIFLPGYILAIGADRIEMAGIVTVSASGYVTGQLIVYSMARRGGRSAIESAPRVSISAERLDQVEALFERYGGPAVFITNFVPYLRGLIFIPAGIARYPIPPLIVYAFTSTIIYHAALVAVTVGAFRAIV